MEWILGLIVIVTLTVAIMVFTMCFVVGKGTRIKASSIYIVNKFKNDNTSPKITDLIDFQKKNEAIKYIVDLGI